MPRDDDEISEGTREQARAFVVGEPLVGPVDGGAQGLVPSWTPTDL